MIESINLNLIPNGVNPVCHVSQYDAGRQIKINLFEGINPYTIQSGDSFTLNVRKPDNTIVTTSVSGTQGYTYIMISTTEQIAAVVGENLCELKITNGSTVIGTLNFIMLVERDVLADGIPSQSVIEDLDERIAEAIGDNYYNKSETDDLLALKADKTEFYNFYPTEQESGAIASFTDGADNIPVKSLTSEIVAVESGSGEKSPDNPYTISGFDSANIAVSSKNLWGNGNVSFTGNSKPVYLFQPLPPDTYTISATVTSTDTDATTCLMLVYYTDGTSSGTLQFGRGTRNSKTANFNKPIKSITFYSSDNYIHGERDTVTWSNIQIEASSEMTAYENPNIYTFAFGQTVYGGHFDNKGNLVVTHRYAKGFTTSNVGTTPSGLKYCDVSLSGLVRNAIAVSNIYEWKNADTTSSDNSFKTFTNVITFYDSRFTDVATANTILADVEVVYPLVNPITLSITSRDIPTALGENNFYSDTGDVDVTIRADIGLYIDKRLNANRSTPNNLVRAAAYVDDPESVNETQEDNVEPQNEER